MNWNESFGKEHMPTNEELLQFLGRSRRCSKINRNQNEDTLGEFCGTAE